MQIFSLQFNKIEVLLTHIREENKSTIYRLMLLDFYDFNILARFFLSSPYRENNKPMVRRKSASVINSSTVC